MLSAEYPTGAGTLRFVSFESERLRGNRYGDPTCRHHPVYLPPSYESEAERRFPVVYGLAGYTASGLHLFAPGTFTETLQDRLDRLIAAGMPELIFVGVDCMTALGGSQYVNGACGPYEDYLVEELLPAVEGELRTTAQERGRGVVGKSSGGFGALRLAMRHPDRFVAVACHSGDAGFEYSVLPEIPTLIGQLDRHEGDEARKIGAFLEEFAAAPKRSFAQGHALMMLALAAAYSPDPDSPAGFRLPVDAHSGEIRPEIWERWLSFDPVRSVERHAAALAGLRLLWIDCGSRDQYGLHLGARQLHRQLERLGVGHVYEEFEDDHSGTSYRYDRSLPRVVSALTPEDA